MHIYIIIYRAIQQLQFYVLALLFLSILHRGATLEVAQTSRGVHIPPERTVESGVGTLVDC